MNLKNFNFISTSVKSCSLAIKFMKKMQLNNHSNMNKTKLRTANSLLRNIDEK